MRVLLATIRRGPMRAGLAVMLATGAAGLAVAALAQEPARTVWAGVYSAEQAARGGQAYAQSCTACHGA